MFHRVKSESEKNSEPEKQNNIQQQEQPSAPAEPKQAPAEPVATEAQTTTAATAPAEETAPQTEPQPEKDSSPMANNPSTADIEAMTEKKQTYTPAPSQPQAPSYTQAYSGFGAGQQNAGAQASSERAAPSFDNAEERRLVIGKGITMSGEIEYCDYLLVEGTIEAALKGAQSLEVSQSGTFYGTVEIDEATVAGRFEGDITVKGRLTITETGSITGSITYGELDIQAGAIIDGKLTPIRAQAQQQGKPATQKNNSERSSKEAAALAKARELKAQNENQTPANNDGELFSDAARTAAE